MFVFLVCILLVALASTTVSAECTPPPVGLWLLQAYEPTIDFEHPLLSGYLKLEIDETNPEVYIGINSPTGMSNGVLILCFAGNAYVQQGTTPIEANFVLTGVFDQDTCVLYGTYIFYPLLIHDTYQWNYDANGTMAGLYRPFLAGAPQFPQHSMHVLQFQRPLST